MLHYLRHFCGGGYYQITHVINESGAEICLNYLAFFFFNQEEGMSSSFYFSQNIKGADMRN